MFLPRYFLCSVRSLHFHLLVYGFRALSIHWNLASWRPAMYLKKNLFHSISVPLARLTILCYSSQRKNALDWQITMLQENSEIFRTKNLEIRKSTSEQLTSPLFFFLPNWQPCTLSEIWHPFCQTGKPVQFLDFSPKDAKLATLYTFWNLASRSPNWSPCRMEDAMQANL